jgi:hypothetical protein
MNLNSESSGLVAAILTVAVLKDRESVSAEMAVSTFREVSDELRKQDKRKSEGKVR